MLNTLFTSVFVNGSMSAASFVEAVGCALILGLVISLVYMKGNTHTKSFAVTLALLPAIVGIVIMMVNGNIGAGVAVAGTFSLVRFRSAAGSAQEITAVFLAMAVGLATGMGYLFVAAIFTVIILLVYLCYQMTGFGDHGANEKLLKIIVPESLDFEGIFDDIFAQYTSKAELLDVRTSGMGSLYKLSYKISLRDQTSQKEMIDAIRTRNGNLEISCSRNISTKTDEL